MFKGLAELNAVTQTLDIFRSCMGLINMPHALWEALLGDLNKQAEDPGGGIAKRALEN